MGTSNSLTQGGKPKFSVAIQTPKYQQLVNSTLGDPVRARRFVAAVISAVSVNPELQKCDAGTVLSAALLGESLNLSPSPQLGQYYMVPYNDKNRGKVAQFQIGYKGLVQLAVRSGYYRKIVVLPIKEGELVRFDPMEEEISVRLIEDDNTRETAPTVGYYAMFEYIGGSFRKIMYWSREKMEHHADRYSKAFSLKAYQRLQAGEIPEGDLWKFSSFWYKNFDDMACKTMLRQLLSRWGILSIDLQTAFTSDESVIKTDLTPDYLDTPEEDHPNEQAEVGPHAEGIDESVRATDAPLESPAPEDPLSFFGAVTEG